MSIKRYTIESTDKIQDESSGGCSLRGFGVIELLNTRHSWESLGISKGKLLSTMIYNQHESEVYPYMTVAMNGIISDKFSPYSINSTREIIMFSPSAMLP